MTDLELASVQSLSDMFPVVVDALSSTSGSVDSQVDSGLDLLQTLQAASDSLSSWPLDRDDECSHPSSPEATEFSTECSQIDHMPLAVESSLGIRVAMLPEGHDSHVDIDEDQDSSLLFLGSIHSLPDDTSDSVTSTDVARCYMRRLPFKIHTQRKRGPKTQGLVANRYIVIIMSAQHVFADPYVDLVSNRAQLESCTADCVV